MTMMLVVYALVALSLAYLPIKFVLKQLAQHNGTPGQGKMVGGDYGGKDGVYSRAQVAKHNKQTDLWVVIKGKVFDLSEYVDEHPGGVKAMMKNAGGDATAGFFGPQHPSRAHDMLGEYQVGVLEEEEESGKDK
eukprot:CAMPEP_0197575742 /NCGR_PEP_ID=MMETSP1326-20131121/1031_1 /TAXON_ID=1155430 /ORGANISM="Genus nov. species nov., Strain RCC2288" /LENGTH=133 /DNA_ID=CAMNT_0043138559 /DNA_START=52 /DNA_END=453 /DNA_ORIENTATION=-